MSQAQSKISFPVVAVSTGLVLLFGLGAGRFLVGKQPDKSTPPERSAAASVSTERFKIPVTDTQPSRGPVDALVTIIEFCELRGEQCRETDAAMRALLKTYEGRIRWVHRAFVDPARPEQSHRMHAFGRAAFQHADKFWELREQFLSTPEGVELSEQDYARITDQVGLDYESLKKAVDNRQFDGAVTFDAAFAIKFGVTNGSGLFVNGRKVSPRRGEDLAAILEPVIDAELASAKQMIDRGVAPSMLYAEITKGGRWGVSEQDEIARQAKLAERR